MKNYLFLLCLSLLPFYSWAYNPSESMPQAEIDKMKNLFKKSYRPQVDSDFRIEMIGKKFAAVYTKTGVPIAVFDLTLNPMSLGKYIIGVIGIQDLSLRGAIRHHRKAKRARKEDLREANGKEGRVDRLEHDSLIGQRYLDETFSEKGKYIIEDFNSFDHLVMNEKWAKRKGLPKRADGKYKFEHGSFDLSELDFLKDDVKEEVEKNFIRLAKTFYPQNDFNVKDFMSEFELEYNKEKKEYTIVWNTQKRVTKKKTKIPGVVVNYINPLGNHNYRAFMRSIDELAYMFLAHRRSVINLKDPTRFFSGLNHAMKLAYMVISRITEQSIDRVDYHEAQFTGLLQASQRFEYDPNMPLDLVDPTLDLLYLGRVRSPKSFNDGNLKRLEVLTEEEENFKRVMEELNERQENDEIYIDKVIGKRFITVRNKDDHSLKGIYAGGIKPTFLLKRVSQHVNTKTPVFKVAERVATDVAAMLVKAYVPARFGIWNGCYLECTSISIGISLPHDFYEYYIKKKMRHEQALEAQYVSLVDEAMAQRADLGLSQVELSLVRKRLDQVYTNPYEIRLKKEQEVIEKNLAALKQALVKDPEIFNNPDNLVPMSL